MTISGAVAGGQGKSEMDLLKHHPLEMATCAKVHFFSNSLGVSLQVVS